MIGVTQGGKSDSGQLQQEDDGSGYTILATVRAFKMEIKLLGQILNILGPSYSHPLLPAKYSLPQVPQSLKKIPS